MTTVVFHEIERMEHTDDEIALILVLFIATTFANRFVLFHVTSVHRIERKKYHGNKKWNEWEKYVTCSRRKKVHISTNCFRYFHFIESRAVYTVCTRTFSRHVFSIIKSFDYNRIFRASMFSCEFRNFNERKVLFNESANECPTHPSNLYQVLIFDDRKWTER